MTLGTDVLAASLKLTLPYTGGVCSYVNVNSVRVEILSPCSLAWLWTLESCPCPKSFSEPPVESEFLAPFLGMKENSI